MKTILQISLVAMTLAGVSCHSMNNGDWAGYERTQFLYLQATGERNRAKLKKELEQAIKRKPHPLPGISAEYAYLLYLEGDKAKAIHYFQQEKRLWPLSTKMMDHVIQQLEQGDKIEQ